MNIHWVKRKVNVFDGKNKRVVYTSIITFTQLTYCVPKQNGMCVLNIVFQIAQKIIIKTILREKKNDAEHTHK